MADRISIHIEIEQSDKDLWSDAAEQADMSLDDWVRATLNAALPKVAEEPPTIPLWMRGLSHNSAGILLKAGFESRYQLLEADLHPGWHWTDLPECGERNADEIKRWIHGM